MKDVPNATEAMWRGDSSWRALPNEQSGHVKIAWRSSDLTLIRAVAGFGIPTRLYRIVHTSALEFVS